ncbi:hypothetical protein V9T40_003666 [Parthenolecanium corni]|uniref:VWFA domain-containing protein n=1 Tax=Parthenolecanium corni TaxID=536013 RepID=A0AAN9TRQ7_9HEMI
METLLKYDGFLPKIEGNFASTLYRVNLPADAGKSLPESIVLLVDISVSMSCEMEAMKRAILSMVSIILDRKLASLDQIVLITFQSYARVYSNFKDYRAFEAMVSSLKDAGGTDYCRAIDELIKLLEKRERIIAVMFSDGEPYEYYGTKSVENLKIMASKKSLLLHSIGLNIFRYGNCKAEKILRDLTTLGSTEGFYQSICDTEMTAAMNVLVDHIDCSVEAYINGKRTRCGFIVNAEVERTVVQLGDREVAMDVVNESFQEMLKENSFQAILEALRFLLEYHLRDESVTFDQAVAIANNVSSLIRETESKVRMATKEKIMQLSSEKKAKLNAISQKAGAHNLRQQSEIIAEYNKTVQKLFEEEPETLKKVHELKELCAKIHETLLKTRNISASVSGEVMNAVSKFRDNSIALERKHVARFSTKVREANKRFKNIDKLLQDELDELVKLKYIAVPQYFESYSDPITLNDFQDIILHKFGVFMLLINIERHYYGITAPHKTKIIQIGGFSSSVLDVMMKNEDKSVFFDFRGIGFGNAAVPLWISDLHWRKARHVFGPFVGYAVTGNELEYTKLQGQTLLALILIHLRGLESTEFNEQLIQMVGQTLKKVVDKKKWKKVAGTISNSFEDLNENKIPSIELYLVFQEFVGGKLPNEKRLLLVAEQYRRVNKRRIEEGFEKLKSSPQSAKDKCNFLIRIFPKIFEKYLNISASDFSMALSERSLENYFLNLYDGKNDSKLLNWFDKFSKNLSPSLGELASNLDKQQKIAIILSVHKCTCFKWDAIDEIPAGLSYESNYVDLLLGWCRKKLTEKREKLRAQCHENELLRILRTADGVEAETLLRGIKRNSHTWAVMLKVLLPSSKTKRPSKLTVEQWEKLRIKLFKKQLKSVSIPLHFEILMFCIFDSFKPEDWIPSKMVWRPNILMRRRIRAMFPNAPAVE